MEGGTSGSRRSFGGAAAGRVAALLTLGAALVAVAAPSAAPQTRVAVFFLQGEQLVRVSRPGSTPADAVRRLVAGPTQTELKQGFRTYVPAGTPVRRVSITDGVATIDLSHRFASGRDAESLLARLSQLVRTVTARPDHFCDHAPPSANTGRRGPEAAQHNAFPAERSNQGRSATADRPWLPARRGCRRPVRARDAERHTRLPEVGAARPYGGA